MGKGKVIKTKKWEESMLQTMPLIHKVQTMPVIHKLSFEGSSYLPRKPFLTSPRFKGLYREWAESVRVHIKQEQVVQSIQAFW